MKFSLSWLKAYLETDASVEQIAATLNAIGLEVEGIEDPAARLAGFRIARVLTAARQPERSIADYDATAGPLKQRFATSHGTQRGDPRKAMRMILDALDSPVQTLRLPIGADALAMIRGKIERVGADLDAWDVAARATDIE